MLQEMQTVYQPAKHVKHKIEMGVYDFEKLHMVLCGKKKKVQVLKIQSHWKDPRIMTVCFLSEDYFLC